MIPATTFKFLKELKKNNNKIWFDENRKLYESVKLDFYSVVDKLISGIIKFDPSINGLVAKDCAFRINRDVGLVKIKAPIKQIWVLLLLKAAKK
jgi:uncharacterized protein (TIGR02453 family)